MKSETIKAIFTNLLFVIGVILIIFGFISSTQIATKMILFDKYPLNTYEETRCETEVPYNSVPYEKVESTAITQQERERLKTLCKQSLEHERKVRQSQDIVTSISTLVSGIVLVVAFRRFIFK